MENNGFSKRPHVICVPYPTTGHINPMMKLAKILYSKGFHVTFVNTHYNHKRLLRARGPTACDGLPRFRFESIPDGLPSSEDVGDVTQDILELMRSTELHCGEPLRALIEKLNDTASSGVPHVSSMVVDMCMFFAYDVAEEFGIPVVALCPTSAGAFFTCSKFQKLLDMGIVPFKDTSFQTNGQLDMVLNWIPGENDIRLKDFPSFIRITEHDDFLFHYFIRSIHYFKKASAILLNTFEALDHDTLKLLSSDFPPMYTIGPLPLILDSLDDEETRSIGSNLWIEDPHCLTWLDSQKHRSVVYVNFGSITIMTNEQLLEFAWGLANSNHPFLWITRPDLIIGDSAIFPSDFETKIKDNGLITNWCDQEKVLAHPAVGGFLTHSGWNSTIESIYNGVPMICWPFFADQQTNCWYCCKKWGIGLEIDTNVKRDELEKQVNELMLGDEENAMRKKVKEWKKLAQEAIMTTDGSSFTNLEKAIELFSSQS